MTTNYQERQRPDGRCEATIDIVTWSRLLPVSFTAENAQKCFDGQKTQTRLLLNPQPTDDFIGAGPCQWFHPSKVDKRTGEIYPGVKLFGASDESEHYKAPFLVGEFFYIREPWRTCSSWDKTKPSDLPRGTLITHESEPCDPDERLCGKLRPATFLQRRFARPARYRFTAVRCERVNSISKNDAIAEGICGASSLPIRDFKVLWDSIHGKQPGKRFEDGPWTWPYTFERVR